MNSDYGHGAKSWYFPPEYAFTQNQKQRSRSARMAVHVGPEYAITAYVAENSHAVIVSKILSVHRDFIISQEYQIY
ncbi:hypothetical protein, partial [Klebsiella pneumoniae]|uniref:hypothetical protein n=1 Tax=Klebsiella pneumoniae TaxID=573 RepID=UPI001A93192F